MNYKRKTLIKKNKLGGFVPKYLNGGNPDRSTDEFYKEAGWVFRPWNTVSYSDPNYENLYRRIEKIVKENPDKYSMGEWYYNPTTGLYEVNKDKVPKVLFDTRSGFVVPERIRQGYEAYKLGQADSYEPYVPPRPEVVYYALSDPRLTQASEINQLLQEENEIRKRNAEAYVRSLGLTHLLEQGADEVGKKMRFINYHARRKLMENIDREEAEFGTSLIPLHDKKFVLVNPDTDYSHDVKNLYMNEPILRSEDIESGLSTEYAQPARFYKTADGRSYVGDLSSKVSALAFKNFVGVRDGKFIHGTIDKFDNDEIVLPILNKNNYYLSPSRDNIELGGKGFFVSDDGSQIYFKPSSYTLTKLDWDMIENNKLRYITMDNGAFSHSILDNNTDEDIMALAKDYPDIVQAYKGIGGYTTKGNKNFYIIGAYKHGHKIRPLTSPKKSLLPKNKSKAEFDGQTTEQCAYYANELLRRCKLPDPVFLDIMGDAWTRGNNLQLIYSGYSGIDKNNYKNNIPALHKLASENFKILYNSLDLDPHKVYTVNMYYRDRHGRWSPYMKQAFNEGTTSLGTHTGNLVYDNNKGWTVIHNIHGVVHAEPFNKLLGSDKQYAITALYEPHQQVGLTYDLNIDLPQSSIQTNQFIQQLKR